MVFPQEEPGLLCRSSGRILKTYLKMYHSLLYNQNTVKFYCYTFENCILEIKKL